MKFSIMENFIRIVHSFSHRLLGNSMCFWSYIFPLFFKFGADVLNYLFLIFFFGKYHENWGKLHL